MEKYDVVVIGAGNGGLAAATRCALEGRKTLLVEQHNLPGGCASSFRRGRFEFDPSVHEICGFGSTEEPGSVRKIMDRLGVKVDWIPIRDCFRCIGRYSDGGPMDVTMPVGREAFTDAMEKYVPGSRPGMMRYFGLIDEISEGIASLSGGGKIRPLYLVRHYGNALKAGGHSTLRVLRALKIPQRAIDILSVYWSYLGVPLDDMLFFHYAMVAGMYIKYYPMIPSHTSHEISMAFISRFRELGGEVLFNCRAEEILFSHGRACGVRTSMGTVECSSVIANVNPDILYGRMMKPEHVPLRELKLSAARKGNYSARMFAAYFGLNRSAEELGIKDYSVFFCGTADSRKQFERMQHIATNDFAIMLCYNVANPDFSPKGTCVCSFTTMFGADDWNEMEDEAYADAKDRVTQRFLDIAREKLDVDLSPYIEEVEMASPRTFARYVGTPEGSVYGFATEGWDSMVARLMNFRKDSHNDGVSIVGAASMWGDGYSSTWINGDQTAGQVCRRLKEAGHEA